MPIQTETFEGSPGGMNLALPQQELDDTEARYIQDALVDYPGLTRRRGPIRKVTGVATLTRKATGLLVTLNPQGQERYAVLNGDNSNGYFSVLSDDKTSVQADLAWPHVLPTSPPTAGQSYRIVDAKPALNGGLLIGVSDKYDAGSPSQGLAFWYGGNRANYNASSITVARGSTAVTAASGFSANVAVGMWLFANTDEKYTGTLIGLVQSVNSDTSITLSSPSPYAITAKAATFQSLRGIAPKVVTGRLTVDVTSPTVSGGGTKFLAANMDASVARSGTTTNGSAVVTGLAQTSDLATGMPVTGTGIPAATYISTIDSSSQVTLSANATGSATVTLTFASIWNIYRAKDMGFVGKVASVQSDISLTLVANAALAMADDRYVAHRADSDYSIVTTGSTRKVGFLNATYAGHQWYANNGASFDKTSRLWFSDTSDPEADDLADFDGDWDMITSTSIVNEPIRGIASSNNGLVVFKRGEAFIVTGTSASTFSPKKLEDDGALSGMSVQQYGGGVVWAGREGIHFFDGIQTENLTATKLGDHYKNTIKTFDSDVYRMWSMVNRDHYFLFIENMSPTVAVVKGNVSVTPTRYTFVVNMVTRAVTFLTNTNIRGAITLPGTGGRNAWFLVNGQVSGDSADHGFIADGEAIFNEEGLDAITADGGPAGPDFYFESKKFNAGDSTRLKKFKQLMLHYLSQGGDIKVDTVIGLNQVGQQLTGVFPASGYTWDTLSSSISNWDNVKNQFATWNDVVFGIFAPKRVKFQRGSQHLSFRLYQSSSAITRLRIGPYHIGFKLKRVGRV